MHFRLFDGALLLFLMLSRGRNGLERRQTGPEAALAAAAAAPAAAAAVGGLRRGWGFGERLRPLAASLEAFFFFGKAPAATPVVRCRHARSSNRKAKRRTLTKGSLQPARAPASTAVNHPLPPYQELFAGNPRQRRTRGWKGPFRGRCILWGARYFWRHRCGIRYRVRKRPWMRRTRQFFRWRS